MPAGPNAGTSAEQYVPLRQMGNWLLKTPTLLTSNATLPTPADIADEVFTRNPATDRWYNGSGTAIDGGPWPTPISGRTIVSALSGGIPELLLWGTGAANDAFTMIVFYARLLTDPARPNIAQIVRRAATSAVTCTLGTRTGVSGGIIPVAGLYVDTISNAAERGLAPLNTRVNGPTSADNGNVSLLLPDPLTDSWVEVYIKTGSSVTGVGIALSENSA